MEQVEENHFYSFRVRLKDVQPAFLVISTAFSSFFANEIRLPSLGVFFANNLVCRLRSDEGGLHIIVALQNIDQCSMLIPGRMHKITKNATCWRLRPMLLINAFIHTNRDFSYHETSNAQLKCSH